MAKINSSIIFSILVLGIFLRFNHITYPDRYIFDEDYFAFTAALISQNQALAYEYWHLPFDQVESKYLYRPPAIEWLHPPVSKLLIALAIDMFGNNPLAWRIVPALSGVVLIIITLILAIKIYPQQKYIAFLAAFLITTDHFLVVESKLAGANVILTLFTTLTILFTFLYWQNQKLTRFKTLGGKYLLFLGCAAGLAIATKWSGLFVVIGCLAWLIIQLKQTPTNHKAKLAVKISVILTIITFVVYTLSYSQFFWLTRFDLKAWFRLHSAMLTFQTTTSEQHPFQSRPWQWPLNQVAIPYYLPADDQSSQSQIWAKSWGLPIGFGAFLISLIFLIRPKKKFKIDSGEKLLLICVACYWLPWFFITRNLFLYHVLPLLPLLYVLLSQRLINLGELLVNTAKKSKR